MLSAERIRRIRWRARRGLLENDIVLARYLDAHERALSDEDVEALDRLLDLSDPELLDLILNRAELSGALDSPPVQRLLEDLRTA
jgi:antitoxin CptB